MAERRKNEEAGGWFTSLRFSGFTVLIVALIVVGGVIVSPTLTTYVNQQRELAELRESVRLQSENVDVADAARAKWLDPAYVRSQARSRLFYVLPGEMQLSIIDDIMIPEDTPVETNEELATVDAHWASTLAVSALAAGFAAVPEVAEEQAPAEGSEGAEAGVGAEADAATDASTDLAVGPENETETTGESTP